MSRTIETNVPIATLWQRHAMPACWACIHSKYSMLNRVQCTARWADLPAEQRERDRHLHIVVPVDRRRNRLDDALADARVLSEGADRIFIFLCQPER